MNRRDFARTAAATAAVACTGPILLGTTRKAGEENPVIGAGEHQYQCNHNWGELPNDYSWQTTHNVVIDSSGLIYITHQGHGKKMDTVIVFDRAGKFVRSFGKDWHGGAHGIALRKEGSEEFLYHSNTSTPTMKVVKTTLKGDLVWQKARPEAKEYEDPKTPFVPTNTCFLPDGGFCVGDGYGSNRMLIYDKDAKLKSIFAHSGKALGELACPHGHCLDNRNKDKPLILVCDRANARLQGFTLEGKPLFITESNKDLLHPSQAKPRGEILLIPDLHARVSILDKDNKPIVHLGDDAAWRKKVLDGYKIRSQPKEWVAGKFVHPHDACFDDAGNIFVTEWVSTGRVTFLKKVA